MMLYTHTYHVSSHHQNQSNPVEECNTAPNEPLNEGSIWTIELREAVHVHSLEVVRC